MLLARFSLLGRTGLVTALAPLELQRLTRMKKAQASPMLEPDTTSYSGVIVDARGLMITPALFPRILTASGNLVYDLSRINPNLLEEQGLGVYSASPAALLANALIGVNPLVVRAIRTEGVQPVDLLIEDDDGAKIAAASERAGFLLKGRVGILID
ncbi:MAG: hypothetical protein HC808_11515 [Candidatus Competibacteraceae bacterium]|nr:hypothetical protein [Candidatus Competibacteraceae bacterium]